MKPNFTGLNVSPKSELSGCGKPEAVLELHQLVKQDRPDIVFLMETKMTVEGALASSLAGTLVCLEVKLRREGGVD